MLDYDALTKNYAALDTEKLIELHGTGTLLDEAYPVLEAELGRRGVKYGPRPPPPPVIPELPFFSGHWTGKQTYESAVGFVATWVPTLLGGAMLLTYRLLAYLMPTSKFVPYLPKIFAALMIPYMVFAAVCVFRCARNENSAPLNLWLLAKGLKVFLIGVMIVFLILTGQMG